MNVQHRGGDFYDDDMTYVQAEVATLIVSIDGLSRPEEVGAAVALLSPLFPALGEYPEAELAAWVCTLATVAAELTKTLAEGLGESPEKVLRELLRLGEPEGADE